MRRAPHGAAVLAACSLAGCVAGEAMIDDPDDVDLGSSSCPRDDDAYTPFAPDGASPRAHMRFEAEGTELSLRLDGRLVLTASSPTFGWGTAGIRIDAADGTYLDDLRVTAP